MGGTIINLF